MHTVTTHHQELHAAICRRFPTPDGRRGKRAKAVWWHLYTACVRDGAIERMRAGVDVDRAIDQWCPALARRRAA